MTRVPVLPLLAVAGVAAAAYVVATSGTNLLPAAPLTAPAQTPFLRTVAGAGLVEPSTRPIAVGTWRPPEAVPLWRMLNTGPPVNDRQRLVVNRLLDGFAGRLTTSEYAKLAKCSADTALRDIQNLVDRGALVRGAAGGRSTSYELVVPRQAKKSQKGQA